MAVAKKVLLDTNFLLIPAQFGVDIFAELERVCDFKYEVGVLDATVAELEGISASGRAAAKDRKAARLGMQLIASQGVRIYKPERKVFKSTDKAILEFASAGNKDVIVATQDRELKRLLKAKGVRVAVLRQGSHIVLDG